MKHIVIRFSFRIALAALLMALVVPSAIAQQSASAEKAAIILKVYGTGGPAPAMREAAKVFGAKKGTMVGITAGPTWIWKDLAMKDADLIFSSSEYMMTDFVRKDVPGLIDTPTIRTLYLRPSAILVRPGNPKGIKGIKDLARPGVKILVVEGAGQVGMWEDVAGRTGSVKLVDGIRRNIGLFAANSDEAMKIWDSDLSYDGWLVWTIWQKENPASADIVNTEPENTIYRSCAIGLTNRSEQKALAKEFADFLQSAEGKEIFVKWGWIEP
ncbi:MAG: substrate-binding domain-containing protein [Thermodesulfovibrionales bacterium]